MTMLPSANDYTLSFFELVHSLPLIIYLDEVSAKTAEAS